MKNDYLIKFFDSVVKDAWLMNAETGSIDYIPREHIDNAERAFVERLIESMGDYHPYWEDTLLEESDLYEEYKDIFDRYING